MRYKLQTLLIIMVLAFLGNACQEQPDFYTMEDYKHVRKIDAHFHIYTDSSSAINLAARDNFHLFAINTLSGDCDRVGRVDRVLRQEKQQHQGEFEYSATFCLENFDEEAWVTGTIGWIDTCLARGASAVKIWKNIGMELNDKNGNIIMIDDIRFDPILDHLEESGFPLVAHLGEPRDCWLPVEEMHTKNNRGYFSNHPEYHMYLHPELPSYADQLMARQKMMDEHPDLRIIACHLASLEWSVDEIGIFLDRYPNAAVDMSARMGNLFYQTVLDRERVREFFLTYQDQIIYGTDIIERAQTSPEQLYNRMHRDWKRDWEYLVTDHPMTSRLIEGEFNGLKLPCSVVDKIYKHNALNWYKGFNSLR